MAISEDSHPSFVIQSLENLEPSFHPRKIVMYVSIGKLEFKEEDMLWTCHRK
jgi:heterodisulfide reductase subunit C